MRIRATTAVTAIILAGIILAGIILAGCEGRETVPEPLATERAAVMANQARSSVPAPSTPLVANAPLAAKAPAPAPALRWDLQSSGEGVALVLMPRSGRATIRLFCPAGENRLLVNVPAFRPVASEERLSFGSRGNAVALVADTNGDRRRGGVSAAGEVPDDLARLVAGSLSANYGAQGSGPHPAPPSALSRDFVTACRQDAAAAPATRPAAPGNPCLVQDGKMLRSLPLRAVGTEPFWGARIEGRCVTFSDPEDPNGTRIWTRFTAAPGGGGVWLGALDGRPFALRTRARPNCSDGMSDKSYPLAVELTVRGERRSGCAEPF